MNIFIDCEFNDDYLISIALVADDGNEFYKVFPLGIPSRDYDEWVLRNVIPFLNKKPEDNYCRSQEDLERFFGNYDTINIIADWTSDIKFLCQFMTLNGGENIINTPKQINFTIDRNLNTKSSVIPHNALEDARALRNMYHELYTNKESK